MKPSFIPYFFSKVSLYFALRSMTFFMSISLNVVSIAAVQALKEIREINAEISGDEIIYKNYIEDPNRLILEI